MKLVTLANARDLSFTGDVKFLFPFEGEFWMAGRDGSEQRQLTNKFSTEGSHPERPLTVDLFIFPQMKPVPGTSGR